MVKWVLEVGLSWALLYCLLPAFLSRIVGLGVTRSVKSGRAMALTFDDGPHPAYTPLVLDLLHEHGAKATFFIVGAHAEKHPELVQRMHREGHAIGIHEKANSDLQLAKSLLMEMKSMLAELASYLDHPERESVKALYGISLIHRGVRSLGFTTVSLSRGLFYYATTWYLRLLLAVLHPTGRSRLQARSHQLIPKQVILSRTELFSRYAKKD